MTSGIYRLTFKSGRYYIGKSVDIPARWRQHYDKLRKGTGAARLQQEFNRYHDYNQEVLLECHPDHIDIMETYFINYSNKDLMLNTTFPTPLSRAEYKPILANIELLKHSTSDHIAALAKQSHQIYALELEVSALKNQPAVIIKEYGDSTNYIKELLVEIVDLESENETLVNKVVELNHRNKSSSWWSKLCN